MDVLAGHLGIAHQKNGGGQTGKAGTYDVGGLVFDALGLAGMYKRFIITVAVIHIKYLHFVEILFDSGLNFPQWRYYNSRVVSGHEYSFYKQPCAAAQHHVPAGDAGHLPEAEAGSGPRPPYASIPEVMATFFAGGISESLRSWFTGGKKRSEEDIKKQLRDIMRAVYQVENIQEQEVKSEI